ncbi:MAG TPA: hypothetical protein VHT02_05005 [Methylocella sp.]|nr:hypothetical protein [Methylocella sp.]
MVFERYRQAASYVDRILRATSQLTSVKYETALKMAPGQQAAAHARVRQDYSGDN